jgi:hypothetical protein
MIPFDLVVILRVMTGDQTLTKAAKSFTSFSLCFDAQKGTSHRARVMPWHGYIKKRLIRLRLHADVARSVGKQNYRTPPWVESNIGRKKIKVKTLPLGHLLVLMLT